MVFSEFVTDFFSNIILWWPWISFWTDVWFIQLCIIYVFYLFLTSTNPYYTLLYLFIEIFYFGLFLCIYQMDLFTGFLWVVECTVIFVSLILLFYLNAKGNFSVIKMDLYKYNIVGFCFFFIFLNYKYPSELENFLPLELNNIDIWDDFYEALYNTNMNDFMGLLISYYYLNSLEFLLLGFLLLFGSIACVNLYKMTTTIKLQKYDNFFKIFDFFKDMVDYMFIRKQNLFNQMNNPSAVRVFKKKNK